MTEKRLITALLLCALLQACASLPDDLQQTPSYAWSQPKQTSLGSYFSENAPEDNALTGVRLLGDPGNAFKTRFGLAALAQHTLDLQYYLWKGDLTGQLLLYRTLQAADRGVKVRLLIDDIYHSGRDDVYAALDTHANLEVRIFNPIARRKIGRNSNFLLNKGKLNHRMHNKIFLVDGAIAILGGRNIGDDYFGVDTRYNFRDLDVLVVGEAVGEAATAFDTYWNSNGAVPINVLRKNPALPADLDKLRSELTVSLEQKDVLPYTVPIDTQQSKQLLAPLRDEMTWATADVIVDPLEKFGGDTDSAFLQFGAQMRAKMEKDLVLQSAYLIPGKTGVTNLSSLVEKGVRVRLLTNSLMSNNHLTAHSGYLKYRKDMLRAGVELYELRSDADLREHFRAHREEYDVHAGLHTKAWVVDGKTSVIGSFNMDPRSRDLNSEIALVIYSEEFAHKVIDYMEVDFDPANSYRVILNDQGQVRWQDGTAVKQLKHDPGASIWRRIGARLLSWLPIEKEL